MDYGMRYTQRHIMWELPGDMPEEVKGIPEEEELLPAIIRIYKENGEITLEELRRLLSDYFWMDEDAFYYKPEDWKTPLFYYRVYKIVYYLHRHFLLVRTGRGRYRLSELGLQIAKYRPRISVDEVRRFPVRETPHRYREYEEYEENEIWPNIPEEISYQRNRVLRDDLEEELIDVSIREFGFPMEEESDNDPEETWFNISEEEYWRLFETDVRFRNLIRTGRVILRDGSLYIVKYTLGDGVYSALELKTVTDNRLRIEVRKNFRTNEVYFKDVFYDSHPVTRVEFLTICKKPLDYESPEVEDVIDKIIRELPFDVVGIFKYFKDELKVNWNNLARVIGVSDRELRNWKNPGVDGNTKEDITLEAVVAICLALHFPPELSKLVIERINAKDKNDFTYDPDAAGGEQRVWEWLLRRHYMKTPLEINAICEEKDISCLFSENPEDHEDEGKIDHGVERRDKKI